MDSENGHPRNSEKYFWDFTQFVYQSASSDSSISEVTSSASTPVVVVRPMLDSELKVFPNEPISLISRKSHCEPFSKLMNWQLDRPTIIQGKVSSFLAHHLEQMLTSGTKIVASVCPWPGENISSIPKFDLVADVVTTIGKIKTSIICVSPEQVLDAGLEAIDSGVEQIIIITPNVPPLDMIRLLRVARTHRVLVLGSGSSGLIYPDGLTLGIWQQDYFRRGTIGIIGYDPVLIYETAWALNQSQMGQSWVVSLGTDKIRASNAKQWLDVLEQDSSTEAIVLVQPAQDIDSDAVQFMAQSVNKPVVCYLVGSQAPLDRVYRKGTDILNNHLSQSIPATNYCKDAIASIQKSGLSLATKPSQIPGLIQRHSQILVS